MDSSRKWEEMQTLYLEEILHIREILAKQIFSYLYEIQISKPIIE